MNLATFIIPTIGRPTMVRTLNSLLAQTDPDWSAIVVADNLPKYKAPSHDPRIFTLPLREKLGMSDNGIHHAGMVRNCGMALAVSTWLAFVDDDDRLDPHYIEVLRRESDRKDLMVFKMRYSPKRNDGAKILPRTNRVQDMAPCEVGISFAVRRDFQTLHEIWFNSEEYEDWFFIKRCLEHGARCRISDAVLYYVRH